MRRLLPTLLILLAAAGPAAASAEAMDRRTLGRVLAREMNRAGSGAGAYVRDLESGATLYARRGRVERIPASVEKLLTTAVALRRLGPDARLRTVVLGAGQLDRRGVWRGDLVLRGGGDPTLSQRDITALARLLRDEVGIRRVTGSVLGDESRFDALRGSSRTRGAYDRDMGGVLSALAVGRGFTRHGQPALEAARRLSKALRAIDVPVKGRTGLGFAAAGTPEIAVDESPPLSSIVRAINRPSDNFAAEMLLKTLGARAGRAGTTAAGAAVLRTELRRMGVRARVSDGSGLARANRIAPAEVVDLLEAMSEDPVAGPAFLGSLAVAGRNGTLRRRMRRTAAAGDCRAKTGTIYVVSTLAGICTARDGSPIAFAFLMNGVSPYRARGLQDRMADALARYDG